MKTAPSRKTFWFFYLGLVLALHSQKEARGLAVETRPATPEVQTQGSGENSGGATLPKKVVVTWDVREGDKPNHYHLQYSTSLAEWQDLNFDPNEVKIEGDRYSITVGDRSSIGPRFFVRSVHEE